MTKKVLRKTTKGEQLLMDYQFVFSSVEGQRVFNDLVKECGLMDNTYQGNVNDMIFCEGRKSILLMIFKKLKIKQGQLQSILDAAHEQGVMDEF